MTREKLESNREALEGLKRASVAQLLFKSARLLNDYAIAQMVAMGFEGIRVTHTRLFPHVDLEGTRMSVLAERVGVSKQAIGQWVDELEEMGLLERVADPDDGRAKLVRFARDGESLIDGVRALIAIEQEFSRVLGEERWQELGESLAVLLEELEGRTSVESLANA
ncbi:MAG: MarR family transcriptional regulator [Myxococcota bacterium]|nr:MarR family transcriptional regulator [Myxococcota bacterium]MEC9443347.1 MarR family transcriptional regulator [Myxococcota bacterium]